MKYALKDLINIELMQELTDELYLATGTPSAIISMDGEILTGSGWQRICTDFHRKHPDVEIDCLASDTAIRKKMEDGEPFVMYRCPRGLVDASIPLVIEGEHLGNVFAGQLFTEPPDEEVENSFRLQAHEFGFDEEAYMAAFRELPVFPVERFRSALNFLARLAEVIAGIGHARRKEIETSQKLIEAAKLNEEIISSAQNGIIVYDLDYNYRVFNPYMEKLAGKPAAEVIGRKPWEVFDFLKDAGLKEVLERCLAGEEQITTEVQFVIPESGLAGYASDTSTPLRDSKGEIVGVLTVVRDITDQKIAQEELNAARAELEQFFDLVPDLVVIASADGYFKKINKAWEKTLGYSAEELMSKPFESFTHPDDIEPTRVEVQKQMGGSPTINFINRYRCKDGTYRRLDWVSTAVSEGKTLYAAARDITDRMEAVEQMKESEEKYRSLYNSMIEGVALHEVLYDESGAPIDYRIIDVNPKYEAILGITREAAIGQLATELYGAVEPPYLELYAGVAASGEAAVFETYFSPMEKHFNISVFSPGKGKFATVFEDITDRKKAEEAVVESHNLLKNLAALVPGVIYQYQLNPDGSSCFPYSSPGMNDIYEVTPEEVREDASAVFTRLHPDDYDRVAGLISESARELTAYVVEFRVILPRQGLRWRYCTAHPQRTENGGTLWHGIISDITDSKQAEEEKRNLEGQLQQSQKMEAVGNLAGGIAHDFNNLLTGILGHANLLKLKSEPDTKVYEAAKTIERAAERASELTAQLLGFARKGKHLKTAINVRQTIQEVINILGRTLDRNISIVQKIDCPDAIVLGDPGQMQQVIMNLALNARDAMKTGGELCFQTEQVEIDEAYSDSHFEVKPGTYLKLSITDTGCGIEPENISRIFEPFFTTKGAGKGSGMGLAMVYGIVKNHDGFINVYSEPGVGTTFNVYLALEGRAQQRAELAADETTQTGSGKILLIDDEEIIRNVGEELLESLGYEVTTAVDGVDGLNIYHEAGGEFDLVIIDMVMPNMGGRDCYQELRKINPDIKAILSTGYGINGRAQAILDEGINGFVQKPYRLDQLGKIVATVLADNGE